MKKDFKKLEKHFINSQLYVFNYFDIKAMNDCIYNNLTEGKNIEKMFSDNDRVFILFTMYNETF